MFKKYVWKSSKINDPNSTKLGFFIFGLLFSVLFQVHCGGTIDRINVKYLHSGFLRPMAMKL